MSNRLFLVAFATVLYTVISTSSKTSDCEAQDKPPMPNKADDEPATYSIALRLRRVVYEDAYIAVPVTDAIVKKKDDGTFGIDPDAMVAEAIRISKNPKVEWKVETSKTEPHPVQQQRPENRRSYDPFVDEPTKPK